MPYIRQKRPKPILVLPQLSRVIKSWCYFIYTCFWWLCYYYLTSCRSNFCHTVVVIQFPPLQICSYRSPSLVIYGHGLPFTTNSTFFTIVTKNIYNKKFPNQLYIQQKSHNVCYIQSCYIADTCTERVTLTFPIL